MDFLWTWYFSTSDQNRSRLRSWYWSTSVPCTPDPNRVRVWLYCRLTSHILCAWIQSYKTSFQALPNSFVLPFSGLAFRLIIYLICLYPSSYDNPYSVSPPHLRACPFIHRSLALHVSWIIGRLTSLPSHVIIKWGEFFPPVLKSFLLCLVFLFLIHAPVTAT